MKATIESKLNYMGDDESGAFVEALQIKTEEGQTIYLIYRGHVDHELKKFIYEKAEFSDKISLLKSFPGTFVKNWERTDSKCGYENLK